MSELEYCVYVHTSPSGKRYVGITSQNPTRRWKNGHGYRNNEHFWNAIVKYGWDNFLHEIVDAGLDEETAKLTEVKLVSLFRSNEFSFGYNRTIGGDGMNGTPRKEETKEKLRSACRGWSHSDEAKSKISARAKEMWKSEEYREWYSNNRSGENHYNYGEKMPDHIKAAIRKANVGRKATDEWRRNASARFSGAGNPNYGVKLSEEVRSKISATQKKRMENAEIREHLRSVLPHKKVHQYSLDGRFLATYEGLHEAERATGIRASNISLCCRHQRKTTSGYRWEFGFGGDFLSED